MRGSNQAAPTSGDSYSADDASVTGGKTKSLTTTLRFAHLAPRLGPIDLCYQVARTGIFEGPILSGGFGSAKRDASAAHDGDADASEVDDDASTGIEDAGAADSGKAPPSVPYRGVSRYFTITATGTLTIAIVEPGSTTCKDPLFLADVTLDPGKLSTLAVFGGPNGDAGTTQLSLVAFTDNPHASEDKARARLVHAALDDAEDAGLAAPLSVTLLGPAQALLAERIDPRSTTTASSAIPVDDLGYATIPPIAMPSAFLVREADGGVPHVWTSEFTDLTLRAGSIHTGFVLPGEHRRYEVLWCDDVTANDDVTTCTRIR
ncbi:hypothetical protein AKJ09_00868 [Labilithrix luteola]|uniref:DUF4397 domain-containing protein n=1 Tax=Labilithrix luteola TaxID=1391654 RepID=A0A0K1PM90_9BACT|nr:hypothetical protein AKJ09_00868 [Labilithrix luteola]